MTDEERAIRQRLKDDYEHYALKCLRIRTKGGKVEPFILNRVQLHIHQKLQERLALKGRIRAIILKGRQQGCSTYVEGRLFWKVTHHRGLRAFILTHDAEASKNLFEMAQRYYQYCPLIVRPDADTSNAKELNFGGIDSGYKVGTAGNKSVGRSSTVQLFHGSEVAHWPNALEHAMGILQAIPDAEGTEVFLESTADGLGNYFHDQWQQAESGESDYMPIFIPWFWQEEYTKEVSDDFSLTEQEEELHALYGLTNGQIAWRRAKVKEMSLRGGEKRFMQEYPCTSTEAFQTTGDDSYIMPDIVMRARKANAEKYGALVIGVDPARFGDDRTSIIRRRGRVAYNIESHKHKDTMEVVGIVHMIIKNENPDKVFVDVGGLGAGVVDRLHELGYAQIVEPVNSGSSPLDAEKYGNKRAEMWGVAKEWLNELPCEIPDSDSLHADLCAPKYKFDSNTRLWIERKEDIKKRGLRSPDEADAFCLTFAFPVSNVINKQPFRVNKGSFMAA